MNVIESFKLLVCDPLPVIGAALPVIEADATAPVAPVFIEPDLLT